MKPHYTQVAKALGSFALLIGPVLAAAGLAHAFPAMEPLSSSSRNVLSQRSGTERGLSPQPSAVSRRDPNQPLLIDAPAPEQRQAPVAIVPPVDGVVNVKLWNATYAEVSYQLLGHTTLRTLPGRTTITLQGADVPTTLTFQRKDSGLLQIVPTEVDDEGTLTLTLQETLDFEESKVVMSIEPSGQVFLN